MLTWTVLSAASLAAGVAGELPESATALPAPTLEITVTAQRRAEAAETVPIAVTALSGGAIQREPVRDLQDLQRYLGALQTSQISRDDTIIVLRGQGPGVGAFPGVLTYFNEVPFRGLGEGFYYDLESVQVLKGPQGTLFGRNSNGGAVLFTSRAPSPELGGYIQAQIGNFDDREIQGAINLPVSGDRLMLRVAGNYAARDGFTRDVSSGRLVDDRDVGAVRASLRWQPDDSIRNDIVADYTRVSTNGTSAILLGLNPASPLALLPPQLQGAAQALLAQQQALGPRRQVGSSTDTTRRSSQFGIQDRLEIDVSDSVSITNIFAWRRYKLLFRADYDGTPLQLLDYSITPDGHNSDEEQFTEELQLRAESGIARVTGGFYLQANKPAGDQRQIGVIFFQPTLQINDADDLSRAAYAQVDFNAAKWVPGLTLSAGGRYTWDRRRQRAATVNLATGACGGGGATPPSCILSDTLRFRAPSWSLTAAWQAAPRTLVYLTSRRGYKSGGLNLGQPFAQARVYDPEYLTDVELGVRTRVSLGEASLELAAAVYRGDYSDVQVNALVADTVNNAIYNIVENGASATLQGAELDATLRLPVGIQLGFSYAFTDAQYDRYISTVYGDLSGAPWPYVSKHKGSLTAAWSVPTPEQFGKPILSAHLAFQSESTFGYDPDPFTHEPGYALLDLSLDWRRAGGGARRHHRFRCQRHGQAIPDRRNRALQHHRTLQRRLWGSAHLRCARAARLRPRG